MGLFNFLKTAGAKLFKKEAPTAKTVKVDPEHERQIKIEALHKEVARHGLKVEGLHIDLEGSSVAVCGSCPDQAEREKVILALGNVEGIDCVDDQLTVPEPQPEAVFYTVVKGDSLSKIAKAHYGNAMRYPLIFEANKPMLKDPDKIYPGQVLRIPPLAQ